MQKGGSKMLKRIAVKDGSFFKRKFSGGEEFQSFLFRANDGTLLYIQTSACLVISNVRGGIKDFWLGMIETRAYGLSEIEEIRPETLLTSDDFRVRNFIKKVLEEGVFTFIEEIKNGES